MDELKIQYNELLKRYKKGMVYLDDKSVPEQKRDNYIGMFIKIIQDMNDIYYKLKDMGYVMTGEESYEGFKEVK